MELTVTTEVANWYNEELFAQKPIKYVRFFPRYGGFSEHIPGFSIGISNDVPDTPLVVVEKEDITFFIESNDHWYFEGVHLDVILNETLEEPEFVIKKEK
ncbi:MAG TPA: hypothetical protein VK125_08985 [Bacillota bacterium]|nr:hypothetical protein [Bacillota bacterium]